MRARPGLEALKRAAEDEQFDAVLVDDSSRLSRDNQHFNTLLCLFQFWGISLISVSDGLDMREEHAKVIQRVFRAFIEGNAITRIAKELNDEHVPTKVRLKGGWNVSTVSRILKDEKYIGRFVWNRTTTVKDSD